MVVVPETAHREMTDPRGDAHTPTLTLVTEDTSEGETEDQEDQGTQEDLQDIVDDQEEEEEEAEPVAVEES